MSRFKFLATSKYDNNILSKVIDTVASLCEEIDPVSCRNKDLKKDTATLIIRIHTRKVDMLISTLL
ncbi:MAG: hypothetical protein K2H63_10210 [Paramuribaculum sp.]|nr:hypothetical protein [Paramuribaculum sp.]